MGDHQAEDEMDIDSYFEQEGITDQQFIKQTTKLTSAKARLKREVEQLGALSERDRAFKMIVDQEERELDRAQGKEVSP